MTPSTYALQCGTTPLVLSLPHIGVEIPEALKSRYVDRALAVEDTDWHLEKLYEFALALGASVIKPKFSRYVVDLNRPPDNTPMYPGASNTELCPSTFFNGDPLYREEQKPSGEEVNDRRETYWRPWLFEGKLPDLNLGTASGASCVASLRTRLAEGLASDAQNTHAVDGRFKGGYITRHYGRPNDGIHAVQMEMCQSLYMQEVPPYAYDEAKATQIQPMLKKLLHIMLDWTPPVSVR